jgi:hypothetical protein
MAKVILVEGHESWTAMYINGRREYQDHRISTRQLLRFSQEHGFEMKDVTFFELSEAQSSALEKSAYVGRTFIGYPEKIWDIPEYVQMQQLGHDIDLVVRNLPRALVPDPDAPVPPPTGRLEMQPLQVLRDLTDTKPEDGLLAEAPHA